MERLIGWFESRPLHKTFIVAASQALVFYFAAFLSTWIANVSKLGGNGPLFIHAAVVVTLIAAVVALSRVVAAATDKRARAREVFRSALERAHALIDRLVMVECADLRDDQAVAAQHFVRAVVVSVESLQRTVQAAYEAIEAAFGTAQHLDERVDFEITFMTKSYKDGKITIPAAANRDGKAPLSMVQRRANPNLYDATITATVYASPSRGAVIIEDTENDTSYRELYPDQKKRICSTIVYPVFSDANELLGTLVAHCNRPGFFKRAQQRYWAEFLEVFAKRLALSKRRMDLLNEASVQPTLTITLPAKPF